MVRLGKPDELRRYANLLEGDIHLLGFRDGHAEIELAMPKVTSTPTRWRYDRATALENNIQQGIKELQSIVNAIQ